MSKKIRNWLNKNGFKPHDCGCPDIVAFDRGGEVGIRVAEGFDVLEVIVWCGRAGRSLVKWRVEFPCPSGKLTVPDAVVIAVLKAATSMA